MAPGCILLSGGYSHPFEETGDELASAIARKGWNVSRFPGVCEALESLTEQTDLLVVNALYWTMAQHEKYAADREEWTFELSGPYLQKMQDFVAAGGALLVLHTSVICFDTQPGWINLIGGGWHWGRSYHPPLGKADIRLTPEGQSVSSGPATFSLQDEVYHALNPSPDCTILAEGNAGEGFQPVVWVRPVGKGLVAVNSLGHDGHSLRVAGHRALIDGILEQMRSRHA
ncbi:MAG: ThuA domain-containing protein [Sphingomonadaceae bacterium]